MKMREIDVLNNLKNYALWPQSYHLSESEAKVCIQSLSKAVCEDSIIEEAEEYETDLDNCN